ncbi:MAG: HAD hydrolase-like protein [Candidatus Izemoplasmatales bacterium]|nr:HAD hydrolase-like protein [Candidatus Izemoplasmatales bacterium]
MFDTVMFDLDGTLLPLDEDKFIKIYFEGLGRRALQLGFNQQPFFDALKEGIRAMVKNDGTMTNDDRFFETFSKLMKCKRFEVEPVFLDYYQNEFSSVRASSWDNPLAKPLIRYLNEQGIKVILATNPLFPRIATKERMRWINLETAEFCDVTTYDNSSFSKPNLDYYRSLIVKHNLEAKRTIMIGNDVFEDMIASRLGLKTFLVTDCLKNQYGESIDQYSHGSFQELDRFLRSIVSGS